MTVRPILRGRRTMPAGDEGVGLVLVIGISVMVFSIVAAATAYAVNGIVQSRQRSGFERSLAAAENGIDLALSKLSMAFTDYNKDFPVPSNVTSPAALTSWCQGTPVTFPAYLDDGTQVSNANGVFVSEAAERQWATQRLTALQGVSGCIRNGAVGQFVVLKPLSPLVNGVYPKSGKVYAMGAIPSFADASAELRLVKNEYVFMPYRPLNAILTGSTLQIGSSVVVTGAAGVDPSVAGIHTNGSISINGGSASTVTGKVTQTAPVAGSPSIGGQTVTHQTQQRMPEVDAEKYYHQAPQYSQDNMTSWFDLCPDGTVRPYSISGPCTNTTVLNRDASGALVAPFRGWKLQSGGWWEGDRSTQPGTYYAHLGSIRAKTGGPDPKISGLTLIASANDKNSCSAKRYGNIEWSHHSIMAPAMGNMFFYADGDVKVNSNIQLGQGASTPPVVSGMVVARDQVDLNTSSNSAVGAVVATDACTSQQPADSIVGANSISNMELYYDPHSDAPFTSIITTSLWLDYSG